MIISARQGSAITVIGSLIFSACAAAQPPQNLNEAGWVGLYNPEIVAWLENGNRINELCPPSLVDEQARTKCRHVKLAEKEYHLSLHGAPSESSTAEGEIIVTASPAKGLHAYYQSSGKGKSTEFVPDLYDADWGYGPYFHQTYLERRGDWFLLPANPHHKRAWVNLKQTSGEPQVRGFETGEIVTSAKGDFIILGIETNYLRVREEQPADMGCEEGEPPPVKKSAEIKLPVEELYTPDGHLSIAIKYTRGC